MKNALAFLVDIKRMEKKEKKRRIILYIGISIGKVNLYATPK